jgi:hypothetical protein
MPVRGSGIGASWGAHTFGGTGGATGRPVSPTVAAVYPSQGAQRQTSAAGWSGPTLYLMILVGLEVLALLCMRHGFRHHHGG